MTGEFPASQAPETTLPPLSETAVPVSRRFSLRGFTSLLLTLAFLAMCVSGAMLFVTPRGRTANWTDWTLLALDKHQWGAVHVNNSILFVLIATLHLVLNWSVFTRYIKKKANSGLHMKKELALAVVVAGVCIAGPIKELPPFSTLMALNEDIKNYWEGQAAAPPVPHAEELTLAELATTINLSEEQVTQALEEAGYEVSDASQTVGDLGEQKNAAPNVVFDAIRAKHPDTRGWGRVGGSGHEGSGGRGAGGKGGGQAAGGSQHVGAGRGGEAGGQGGGWGRGQGRGQEPMGDMQEVTVAQIASAVAVSEEDILATLVAAGFAVASGETTLGQLSEQQGVSPQEVLDTLREGHPNARGWGRITGQRGGGWH